MDRLFSPGRTVAGVARYVPQFYIPTPPIDPGGPTDPGQPGITVLTVDGPATLVSTLSTDSLGVATKLIDTPAPRTRCIVLGSRDNRIIL